MNQLENPFSPSRSFLLLAIICCGLTVVTTIGIHSSLFDLGQQTFEERLLRYENPTYMLNRFWVIFHCLFVLIGMFGFFLIQFKKSPGFVGMGFVFFAVFAFTEIFRQMFVLFYLNNLRRGFLQADDPAVQEMIRVNMDHAGLVGYAMFGLFVTAFALGNICYGISLLGGDKFDRILAWLLLIWGIGNLVAFSNEFWQSKAISGFLEVFNVVYQPLMRALVTYWLFRKFKELFYSN